MSLANTQVEATKPWIATALRPRILHIPFPSVYRPQRRDGSAWAFPGLCELALAYANQSLRRHQRKSGRLDWFDLVESLREHVLSGRMETVVHGNVTDRVLARYDPEKLRVDEYTFLGSIKDGDGVDVLNARIRFVDSMHAEGRVRPRIEDLPPKEKWYSQLTDEDCGYGPQWSLMEVPDAVEEGQEQR